MSAECCGAMPRDRPGIARRGRHPRRIASLVALGPAAIALIALPKCPLCVAAQLAMLGIGVGAASAIAPLVWPLGLVLVAVALGIFARRAMRR